MNRYTIYCTEKQTHKALELGAPIKQVFYNVVTKDALKRYNLVFIAGKEYKIPTAEEMIGWLEDKGIYIDITNCYDVVQNYTISSVAFNPKGYTEKKLPYPSRKEATLATIDAALEYLENLK